MIGIHPTLELAGKLHKMHHHMPEVKYAVVANIQFWEQYNLDDPIGNPYWKPKGGDMAVIAWSDYEPSERDMRVLFDMCPDYRDDEYSKWDLLSVSTVPVQDAVAGLLASDARHWIQLLDSYGSVSYDVLTLIQDKGLPDTIVNDPVFLVSTTTIEV